MSVACGRASCRSPASSIAISGPSAVTRLPTQGRCWHELAAVNRAAACTVQACPAPTVNLGARGSDRQTTDEGKARAARNGDKGGTWRNLAERARHGCANWAGCSRHSARRWAGRFLISPMARRVVRAVVHSAPGAANQNRGTNRGTKRRKQPENWTSTGLQCLKCDSRPAAGRPAAALAMRGTTSTQGMKNRGALGIFPGWHNSRLCHTPGLTCCAAPFAPQSTLPPTHHEQPCRTV